MTFGWPLLLALVSIPASQARAGEQMYEPLSASVRAAMSAAVSDSGVPTLRFADPADGYRWLAEMSERLKDHVPDAKARVELLKTVHYEATRGDSIRSSCWESCRLKAGSRSTPFLAPAPGDTCKSCRSGSN